MMYKKRVPLILGGCIMVLGIAIGGVVFAGNQKSGSSSDKAKIENSASEINVDDCLSYSSEEDMEAAYEKHLVDVISSEVEKTAGISDCVIDVTESNSKLSEVDVCITVNNSFDDALETDIQTYVAQALEISAENVKISYN